MKLFILTILLSVQPANADCRNPQASQCDFYRTCVESKFQCGDSGYPIAYGEKYCGRFNALTSDDLSAQGLRWRDATLVCLQSALSELLFSSSVVGTCDELKTFAFNSHASCYTQAGASICDLSVSDWAKIASVPDLSDVLSQAGRTQISEVIKTCKDQLTHQQYNVQDKLEYIDGLE